MALEVKKQWLEQVQEEVIDPTRRIVDPHHHFFVASTDFPLYDLADLRADTSTHNVEQTVYLQCWEGHRSDGPEELRPVGETEWVHGIAAQARQDPDAVQIGAMIGTTEMRLGNKVRPVLEAHVAASPLFRGIRQAAAWDPDESIMSMPGIENGAVYDEPSFREGFAVLAEMDLVFDAYHYHHQTPSFTKLANAFPKTRLVLDHLGTPLGVGKYAADRKAVFAQWSDDLEALAECPNVSVKLGGLAMPWNGFGYDEAKKPPTSDELVAAQSDYYHRAIKLFGAERCMFESNFPVDKCALSYTVLWNAFKKMAASYSESEQDALFRGTATRVYGLSD